jgi:hypothetical protein
LKRSIIPYVIALLLVIILVLIFTTKSKTWDWRVTLSSTSKDPYGLVVNYKLLDAKPGTLTYSTQTTEKALSNTVSGNYVAIGGGIYYDSADIVALIKFVERGNTAFLSSKSVPLNLMFKIHENHCVEQEESKTPKDFHDFSNSFINEEGNRVYYEQPGSGQPLVYTDTISPGEDGYYEYELEEEEEDYNQHEAYEPHADEWSDYKQVSKRKVTFDLLHPGTKDFKGTWYIRTKSDTTRNRWSYIDSQFFCSYDDEQGMQSLGTMNESSNFARIKYGQGYFYLHSTPEQFSNIYLIDQEKADFVQGYWAHLQPGNIIVDEYCLTQEFVSRQRNRQQQQQNNGYAAEIEESASLSEVLKDPMLSAAWYTLLATILLYIIFRGKRRQRAIPVKTIVENQSLEYIRTIGNLQFGINDARDGIKELLQLFYRKVQVRYGYSKEQWLAMTPLQMSQLTNASPKQCELLLQRLRTSELSGDDNSLSELYQSTHVVLNQNTTTKPKA